MSSDFSAPFLFRIAAGLAESHLENPITLHSRSVSPSFQAELTRRIKSIFATLAEHRSRDVYKIQGAEWLLDNDYVVRDALKQLNIDLPTSFYRQLQQVEDPQKGQCTRVESLICRTIDVTRLPLDIGWLEQFTSGYQSVTPLNIGELWALPALLRAVILEQLCDSAEMLFANAETTSLDILEASDRVAGCVVSLSTIDNYEWREFVERVCRVDQVLSRDPAGAYASMDFETRNSYRNVIEKLAARCASAEWEIAKNAVDLAANASGSRSPRRRHVGYFLIDDGLRDLEMVIGYKRTLAQVVAAWVKRRAGRLYVLTLVGGGLILMWLLFDWLETVVNPFAASAISVLALPAIFWLCSGILNRIVTRWLTPTRLPKLDFSDGISEPWKTVVAVPAMLGSADEIDALIANLEITFLGNPNRLLSYVLVTDYLDAAEPESDADQALLEYVTDGINRLNTTYDHIGHRPFHLFHRRRLWNESENCWMGWERKRGKLEEFNGFLQGKKDTSFIRIIGDRDRLRDTRLVICLDADSHLGAGAAKRMVGTFAHPLNRPEFDEDTGRLVGGYTILQPRVEINPASANSSLFSRVFTGDVTLDLYSHAVSDVYQDLLGEGIFVGKGIYDLEGFTRSVEGNIPENRVLSHDLLESLHGRAALVTDIVLFEDYPPTLMAYTRRQHRWIRGDWQLLPWLGLRPPKFGGRRTNFRPPLVGRWKMFDNLSRSLLAPCLLSLILCGWALLADRAWLSTIAVAALPGLPILFEIFATLRRGTWRWGKIATTLAGKAQLIGDEIIRWLLTLTFLPYQALLAVDAILRTLFRILITRKGLLEWTSSAQVARSFGSGLGFGNTFIQMSPVIIFSVAVSIVVTLWSPEALSAAMPLVLAWLLSPLIAWWVGQPVRVQATRLSASEAKTLRPLARRTWHFFEAFVGPENQWLPPDNIQQIPKLKIAQRTSPTNIGFALLSSLAAYDFGYLAPRDLVARINNTLQTLDALATYRGHFLNWISTSDLSPLEPRYVSTVDSGNIVACLMALVQGLEDMLSAPLPSPQLQNGIVDTTDVMQNQLDRIVTDTGSPELDGVRQVLEDIRLKAAQPSEPVDWWRALRVLETRECLRIERETLAVLDSSTIHWSAEDIAEFRSWISSLRLQVHEARREIEQFQPWISLFAEMPGLYRPESKTLVADVADELQALLTDSLTVATVDAVRGRAEVIITRLDGLIKKQPAGQDSIAADEWNSSLRQCLEQASTNARQLRAELQDLIRHLAKIIDSTDFGFLYDRSRHVFHIGYNVSTGELDTSYYDLLASEARLASFVALAKQQVPLRHWLHLGRPLSRVNGFRVLLSWSATAFEYLMPRLLMECPDHCLLDQSCRTTVKQQQDFAGSHRVPWGISESGYYHFDQDGNYQYRAFGVPQLGLKRSQGDRLVIAPYASALALPFDPASVVENLEALRSLGMEGAYGMFEAIDYGDTAHYRGGRGDIVGSYMSHHQGMIMLALSNALLDDNMVRRFHSDPRVASLEQLLYEAIPRPVPMQALPRTPMMREPEPARPQPVETWNVDTSRPGINVISNGRLHTRLTSQGGGGQHWKDVELTAWDPVLDGLTGGFRLFFRDLDDGDFWSIGAEQLRQEELEAEFGPHLAMFRHRRQDLLTRLTVVVAADADIEIRRLVVTNESDRSRRLVISCAGEPVLTQTAEFRRHPAFSRLFIESKFIDERGILMFRRRPRNPEEPGVYLGHAIVTQSRSPIDCAYENDRAAFLGRQGDPRRPQALTGPVPEFTGISDTADPQIALAATIEVPARATVQLALLTAVADTQRGVLDTMTYFQSMERATWAVSQAKAHSEQDLQRAELTLDEVREATQLLAHVIWPNDKTLRRQDALYDCNAAQATLWRHGVSGDHPVIVASIHSGENLQVARRLLKSRAYWNLRGVTTDIVLIDESIPGYVQPVRDRLRSLIEGSEDNGRSFNSQCVIVPASELHGDDRHNLVAVAAVYIGPNEADIDAIISRRREINVMPPFIPVPSAQLTPQENIPLERPDQLVFDNGFGGFSHDGREYVIYQSDRKGPPAPWTNIISNRDFGCITTSAGIHCTWMDNSSEYRLTRWSNDPVTEDGGEAMYLRDEETGLVWSPTPLPNNDGEPYKTCHGQGYTRYEHNSAGLEQVVTVFVDPDEPVKIILVELTNTWHRVRRLTATYAVRWILGNNHVDNAGLLVADSDSATNAILVRNGFTRNHGQRTAFLASSEPPHGFTSDLDEFMGPNRSWRSPPALWAVGLSGNMITGPDCGAVYQVHTDLAQRETARFHFILGAGENRSAAIDLVRRFQDGAFVAQRRSAVSRFWDDTLRRVQIETPDLALDLLTNRWLLYQVLTSRLRGRTGFYQPGGAFGFRDQLQDVLALTWTDPDIVRRQILRAAAVQFEDGDVLHWWHQNPLRGVRTRFSDDLLWLPYAVAEYIAATGDRAILDESVPYLDGRPLEPDQHEHYAEFSTSKVRGSVYEHCCRAIDSRLIAGRHGLPFIGTGDWNDGLNRVGIGGAGESVWMAWFLYHVCHEFAPLCESRDDAERAGYYRTVSAEFATAANKNAWDGDWYLRAFYDNGDPLGGKASNECRIDLNAQTWAGICGAAPADRLAAAMRSVEKHLVDPSNKLIRLLAPPFDKTRQNPGYIKGYPPGVRENGSQYNHAAVWAAWIQAEMNCADKAYRWSTWLNPINRATDRAAAERYRIEPYVLPGDICAGENNAGRGGWSWYSGSAAWYHRLIIEKLLGIVQEPRGFRVKPCVPNDWPRYVVTLSRGDTSYRVVVEQPARCREEGTEIFADDRSSEKDFVEWIDDGHHHEVLVRPAQQNEKIIAQTQPVKH